MRLLAARVVIALGPVCMVLGMIDGPNGIPFAVSGAGLFIGGAILMSESRSTNT